MASLAADLIVYLDPLVSETAGTTLFAGPPVELPDTSVWLTHYAGGTAKDRVFAVSVTAPGVEVARVQLFVRNATNDTARATADAYHALLDGFFGTANSRRIFWMQSIDGTPYSIGQDQRGSFRWVANYEVQCGRTV